jgi:hypothetical protein
MLDREERPDQIDAQDLLPLLDGLLEQRHEAAGDAGIGPDRIELAVFRQRLLDIGFHIALGTGIRRDRLDGAAGIAHEFGCLMHALAAVDDDELRAFLREQLRCGAADAAACAGDDDGFACEAAHNSLPVMFFGRRAAIWNSIRDACHALRRCLRRLRALTYDG